MPIVSKILQLIASLSIIVIIHELGHFLPAKWFGCKVEKFYLFFNPWRSLWKKQIKDTEYGIGWLPLGGYVKIAGMIDESMDKQQLQQDPQPWEFRSKKPWQKIIIMIGGVLMNVILGIIIFIGLSYYSGDEHIPNQNLKYGLYIHPSLHQVGLQNGDIITKVDNHNVTHYAQVLPLIIYNEGKQLTIFRNGETFTLNIPTNFLSSINKKTRGLIEPRIPCIVDSVPNHTQFISNQFQKGDQVIAFQGKKLSYLDEFNIMKQHFKDSIVKIDVLRNAQIQTITLKLDQNANTGTFYSSFYKLLPTVTKKYSFFQAIPVGINKAFSTLSDYIKGLKLLATSKEMKVKENLGGIISIGNMFPNDFSWIAFWILTAVISISIGVMNLLPIPALDGGHIIFALYEWISGKKPSLKVQEYAQTIGMILLLALMFYALGLDILRIFK